MFPDAQEISKTFLLSGKEIAKEFIQGLDLVWVSKSEEVNLSTLDKDDLS